MSHNGTPTSAATSNVPPVSVVPAAEPRNTRNSLANKVETLDLPVHEWYRFVLSYPPHLVRDYVDRFGLDGDSLVLDPFCGTGTTIVECKKIGVPSVGVETHPMSHFAASVKTDWTVDPDDLLANATVAAEVAAARLALGNGELRKLRPERVQLLLTDSRISPRPLHKTLILLESSTRWRASCAAYHRLALAKTVVNSASNLHFGPEVGVRPPKKDADVIEPVARRRPGDGILILLACPTQHPPPRTGPTRAR